jgi:LPXTG-motif cell wall-anchored protein
LANVLDDAEVIGVPVASDAALTVSTIEDGRFSVSGDLAPAQTVTVSYQVKVRADGQRGDNRLGNVLVDPGAVPPTSCEPVEGEKADCTVNPIAEVHDWKTVEPATSTGVTAGQKLTYTLHFTNKGTGVGKVERHDDLTHVLDDATIEDLPKSSAPALRVSGVNGKFAVAGELEPGQTVTVSYAMTVNEYDKQGDHILANYLVDPGATAPGKPVCVPVVAGEPDCTINPIGQIAAEKSVDPKTLSKVEEGDELTYTLRFTNKSAAAAEVDYTDHMSGVLDDADLADGPTVSDEALKVSDAANDSLAVTGVLQPGQTETVTYVVKVRDYDDQGDHELENFLGLSGVKPASLCDDDSLCTVNPIVAPDDDSILPDTGGPAFWLLIAGLVLVLAGGTTVAAGKRRRD